MHSLSASDKVGEAGVGGVRVSGRGDTSRERRVVDMMASLGGVLLRIEQMCASDGGVEVAGSSVFPGLIKM